MHGGQSIDVSAPIDTIPLFVRAGSILPLGAPVESTHEKQAIEKIRIYPGADGRFTLFSDDGMTYAYEKGAGAVTHLRWDDSSGKLNHDGASAWSAPDASIVEVIGH